MSDSITSAQLRVSRLAWATLGYILAVILWGAYVRASGSGAGCGSHWPLCDGQVIPRALAAQKAVEFTHRVTSGLSLLVVIYLGFRVYRAFPKGAPVRRAVNWAIALILLEAIVGAGLVLLELVAHNKSVTRTISTAIHLVNTLLLMASLTLTALWAKSPGNLHLSRWRWSALGFIVVGATGAVTALGDTLFPASSLAAGIGRDFGGTSHFLENLRIVHPVFAFGVGVGLLIWIFRINEQVSQARVQRIGNAVAAAIFVNWSVGIANIIWLAPIPIQMLHLLMANLIWVGLVSFVSSLSQFEHTHTISSSASKLS